MELLNPSCRPRQRGVTLLFALIALGALALAALALVRSVDTGALVVGNVGFKQDATAGSEQAGRRALAWLTTNLADLDKDGAAGSGYYPTGLALDPTGQHAAAARVQIDWDGDGECPEPNAGCVAASSTIDLTDRGERASYVITRLCSATGLPDAVGNDCAQAPERPRAPSGSASEPKGIEQGSTDYSSEDTRPPPVQPYYRVIVRIVGARETTTFTETIVHF